MPNSGRIYKPGDIIYENEPFAYVLSKEYQSIFCDFCLKRNTDVKRCTSCHYTSYCNKKCQKLAWHEHKFECGHLKYLPNVVDQFADHVRLAAKIVHKLKNKHTSEFYDIVDGHKHSFDKLISHKEDILKSPIHHLEILYCIKRLSLFLKSEDMPCEDDAIDIFGKIRFNGYGISCESPCSIGVGLYLGASIIDHSCVPNAVYIFDGPKIIIKAIKEITCNDITEVNVSYCYNVEFLTSRPNFFRKCYCEDCSLPYGESFRTKILDKEKAFYVIEESKYALNSLESIKRHCTTDVFSVLINDLADKILSKQDGVLDDTNMYRMPLFLDKMIYNPQNPYEVIKYGNKLIPAIITVYGDKSSELLQPYNMMLLSYIAICDHQQIGAYKRKLLKLLSFFGSNFEALYRYSDGNPNPSKNNTIFRPYDSEKLWHFMKSALKL